MKKVYSLAFLLALSSGAFAHPCNPDDKDYDQSKCIPHERLTKPKHEIPLDLDDIIIIIPDIDPRDPRPAEGIGNILGDGGLRLGG